MTTLARAEGLFIMALAFDEGGWTSLGNAWGTNSKRWPVTQARWARGKKSLGRESQVVSEKTF
jgi:hypothetical protein